MKEKVLLIGGAGYLGRVISEEFINKNYFVRVLDNCILNSCMEINQIS